MFGLDLKSKTRSVLKKDFGYPDIHRVQMPVFLGIVEQAKLTKVNEYDAAIMFMLSQLNALEPSRKARSFVIEQLGNIEAVMSLAVSSSRDILEAVNVVRDKHLEGEAGYPSPYATFEAWYVEFKTRCSMRHPKLEISDDGGSLIDFMDHEPLRKAHADGVDPDDLARDFALNFNPRTFGKT